MEVRRGDLVLRDMGYFSLSEFTAIELREAWWLTRLPLTTGAMLENGDDLEKYLRSFRGDLIDLPAIVGAHGKKCRLVAIRAAPEVATARRAGRRKKARESGKKPYPKGLIRDGWHLMLTNLDKEQASVSQLAAIYRARWAVEIQFRAWKQALNLGKALNRKSGEHHMQALVLAGMIAHQLGMKIAQRIGNIVGRAWLSYEKLYDLLAVRLIKASGLADVAACDPAKDTGIDLVAKTHGTEEFHAIQCKCFAEDYRVRKADIVTTTNDWSENAENSLHSQTPPVYKIDLHDLETSQIDWAKYQPSAAPALKPKKELRPHQTSAKAKVTHGLASADRGKLIMACGTGKTFTSLKIAEEVAGKNKRVLFLVPSLNLLSQTLTEWTQESAIPLHSFAVCSDVEVGKKRSKDEDIVETFAHELVECWSFLLK